MTQPPGALARRVERTRLLSKDGESWWRVAGQQEVDLKVGLYGGHFVGLYARAVAGVELEAMPALCRIRSMRRSGSAAPQSN